MLFSLSYSVIPEPGPALARTWKLLRPSSRLVVMDMGLTDPRHRRVLGLIAHLLEKLAPGDPYSRPWDDLANYGQVETERFLLGLTALVIKKVVHGHTFPRSSVVVRRRYTRLVSLPCERRRDEGWAACTGTMLHSRRLRSLRSCASLIVSLAGGA